MLTFLSLSTYFYRSYGRAGRIAGGRDTATNESLDAAPRARASPLGSVSVSVSVSSDALDFASVCPFVRPSVHSSIRQRSRHAREGCRRGLHVVPPGLHVVLAEDAHRRGGNDDDDDDVVG